MRKLLILASFVGLVPVADAQAVLFDFDTAPNQTSLPLDVTAGGITAHLSATGEGMSIQSVGTLGISPDGFSGRCIFPNSVFLSDLIITFSQSLSDFSILYSPQELACDDSAQMRVTAYMDNSFVGTNTTTAPIPGTWPTGNLTYSNSANAFNKVVVHYDAPPPSGGDYGVIFLADNMRVTAAAVPEPTSVLAVVTGVGIVFARRRRVR